MFQIFVFLFLILMPISAHAATVCLSGQYLNGDECITPDVGYYASDCIANSINEEYTIVEYIQTNGNAYIDLGHVSPTTNKVKIKFQNGGTASYITNIWGGNRWQNI